jgi:cytosine/adenosine deaminase-related metal-dependent hydrolase
MDSYTGILGASLVTHDVETGIIEPGDLWFEGAHIKYAGPPGGFTPPQDSQVHRIDGRDKVVMPGLVNAHMHSYAGLLKGTVDTIPLDVFMINAIVGAGERSPREVYISALVGCLEMLKTGTTACLDHFSHRPRHDPDALDSALRAYADAGVRVALAPMFSDLPFIDTIPMPPDGMPADLRTELGGSIAPSEPYFEMMADALIEWRDHPYVSLILGVDSPQRCSHNLLEAAGQFCADHGIGNHTHLLEAKTQAAMAADRHGDGFIAYMDELGLINERSSLAHFIWCTDRDVERAAERGVNVIHNPTSNMTVGSGIQPLVRLKSAGIPIAFGSDGLNVGNMSMFEKVRTAAQLHRVTEPDCDNWLPSGELLRMATVNGAFAIGAGARLGSLKPGCLADIVVLDGRTMALSPRGALEVQLCLYETGASVEHAYVNGEQVLRDGEPTRFTAADVLAEATDIAARLAYDNRDHIERAKAYHPYIKKMVVDVMRHGSGPCRLAQLG